MTGHGFGRVLRGLLIGGALIAASSGCAPKVKIPVARPSAQERIPLRARAVVPEPSASYVYTFRSFSGIPHCHVLV
jgi:hypothetical protein